MADHAVRCFATAGMLTLGLAGMAAGQTIRTEEPPLIKSTLGSDLFQFYCSNCHGLDGTGRSPRTKLNVPPPDLTMLAIANGGVFPRDAVRTTIKTGGSSPRSSHLANDLPVWGTIFRGLDPSDAMVEIRIANLVSHLESIQQK